HHRLKIQQRLKPALCDLRLIGGILRVPPWILKNVTLDNRRRYAPVVTETDEGAKHFILSHDRLQLTKEFELAPAVADVQRPLRPYNGRDSRIDHIVECIEPEILQHSGHLFRAGPNVAWNKVVGVGKIG